MHSVNIMSTKVVVGMLALLLLVILVFAWELGRDAGRRRLVLRHVMTAGVAVIMVLAVMTVANSNMGWAKSTHDLIGLLAPGTTSSDVQVVPVDAEGTQSGEPGAQSGSGGDASATASTQTGEDSLPDTVAPHLGDPRWETAFSHDSAKGTWHASVKGPVSGLNRPVTVWTPADYSPSSDTVYDVVVFLHGYPGSDVGVSDALGIGQTFPSLMDQGLMRPTIFVVADLSMSGREPNCVDVAGQPQVETFLTRDLVTSIRTNFPNVSAKRSGWVLAGLSAGGYCAPVIYLRHTDQFYGAISMSGYDTPELGALARADEATRDRFTISSMVAATRHHPIHLYLTATTNDPDAMALLDAVTAKARATDDVVTSVDPDGGHTTATWAKALPGGVQWWAAGSASGESSNGSAQPDSGAQSGGAATAPVAPGHSPLAINGWLTIVLLVVSSLGLVLALPFLALRWARSRRDLGRHRRRGSWRHGDDADAPTHAGARASIGLGGRMMGLLRFLLRVLMVVFVALCVSLTVMVIVNVSQGFFASWTDLVANWRMFF